MQLHWDDLVQLPTIIDVGIIYEDDDDVSLLSAYIIISNLDPNSSSIAHPSCSCHRERLSFPVFYSPNCAVHRPIDTVLYESPSCKKGARKFVVAVGKSCDPTTVHVLGGSMAIWFTYGTGLFRKFLAKSSAQ